MYEIIDEKTAVLQCQWNVEDSIDETVVGSSPLGQGRSEVTVRTEKFGVICYRDGLDNALCHEHCVQRPSTSTGGPLRALLHHVNHHSS